MSNSFKTCLLSIHRTSNPAYVYSSFYLFYFIFLLNIISFFKIFCCSPCCVEGKECFQQELLCPLFSPHAPLPLTPRPFLLASCELWAPHRMPLNRWGQSLPSSSTHSVAPHSHSLTSGGHSHYLGQIGSGSKWTGIAPFDAVWSVFWPEWHTG